VSGLPTYHEALERATRAVRPLDEQVSVGTEEAAGRVLARSIVADRDLPAFDRAMMDGYALRSDELGAVESFTVAGEIAAGQADVPVVRRGECVRISTGAVVPEELDAVIEHELSDRGEPVRFSITAIESGSNIHARGADARAGDQLIQAGTVLSACHIGIAAAVGCPTIAVARRPRAIVLGTGDEVRPVDAVVQAHQIRDSNTPMIAELLRRFGADVLECQHVRDESRAVHDAVERTIGQADVLVTIGGISAGEHDHLPEAFIAHGFELVVRGAAIQPGKPILVGRRSSGQIVVGLPGNPVSSLVCAHLFVLPIVRRLLGLSSELPWTMIELSDAARPNARRQAFRPAIVLDDGRAVVPAWAGSGDLVHTAATSGLVALPRRAEPAQAGERLPFLPFY
jgi:molybdopterin molybdotransferase